MVLFDGAVLLSQWDYPVLDASSTMNGMLLTQSAL